ncbi:MAG: hypothetical protein N4A35_16145 [Flavobacteriales bacterium]|jgi:hypothetical protein|nr:hypothetical protein [Flavobacteriales bacterium]
MSNFFKHKMRSKSPAVIAGWIIVGIVAVTGLAILFGYIIMWLWNWLMPELFGLTTINYWQAVGLFILSKLLFGGFGSGDSSSSNDDSCKSKKHKKKSDFSKWELYDKFWKEEGEQAYQEYLNKENFSETDNETTHE